MKFKEKITFAITLIATSCHTTNVRDEAPRGMSTTDRIARGLDWDNRTLPKNRKHLEIKGPIGVIHFEVPEGWHIQSQPVLNGPRYTLTLTGTFGNLPIMTVELETDERGHLSETQSHQERLDDIQTNFPSAYKQRAGSVRLANGRSIEIVEYANGDGAELASYVPEKGHVSAFHLQAESASELIRNRAAFESVLKSYQAE